MSDVLKQLRELADAQEWIRILSLKTAAEAITTPAADRALAHSILGAAYWNLSRNPWDIAEAIHHTRLAVNLDPLQGRYLKILGTRLVTIGRYREGQHVLQSWMGRLSEWSPEVQAYLVEVEYAMGYAARYIGDMASAELWYRSALSKFRVSGNVEWANRTACALVQVLARRGQTMQARLVLNRVDIGISDAYRLKAIVELLAAEGRIDDALATGELASEHLVELDDPDPWELAELHLLLADLQFQAGNTEAGNMHAELALDALRTSERHDLYTAARLLLDTDSREVSA